MGSEFSISVLLNLCSESMEASNFEILVVDSDTGGPSSITVRMEYLFYFSNSDIVNFVCKTDEREEESIVLLIFLLWQYLNRRWVIDCQVGQKVLFRAS